MSNWHFVQFGIPTRLFSHLYEDSETHTKHDNFSFVLEVLIKGDISNISTMLDLKVYKRELSALYSAVSILCVSIYQFIRPYFSLCYFCPFSASSRWSATFIISKCHLDISSWGQEARCKWKGDGGGRSQGGARDEKRSKVVSVASWRLKIWLQFTGQKQRRWMQMQMHSTCSVSASLHNLRRGKKKKRWRAKQLRATSFVKKTWEKPDDFDSAWGNADSLKGQRVISEKRHFHI